MKIMASDLAFSSDRQWEQMDVSIHEKFIKTGPSSNRRMQISSDGLPVMLLDRVSISHEESMQFQSSYATAVSSKSLVTFDAPDAFSSSDASGTADTANDQISHEQESVMKDFIGGMIDRDVIIKKIQRGEDVVLRDGDSIQPQGKGSFPVGRNPGRQVWEMALNRADIHFEEEHLAVSSRGQVVTEDGRTIDFSMDISFDRTFVSRTEKNTLMQRWQEAVNLTDPLVVSLDGKAPQLSDAWFEFDLDSDGETEQVNFVSQGSGFLAFDKNGDQTINDGSELFGPGTGNGFGELAAFDEDKNQWIDENDAVFSQLSVWTKDENGEDRLMSLKEAGIGAIALDYASAQFNLTQADNSLQGQVKSSGIFLFENGNVGGIHQIDLVSHVAESQDVKKDLSMGTALQLTQQLVQNGPAMNTAPVPSATEPGSSEEMNPLEGLREKIDKLKEEMGRLYERLGFSTPDRNRRRKGVRHYQEARQYQLIHPDTTMFMPGFQRGTAFPERSYF